MAKTPPKFLRHKGALYRLAGDVVPLRKAPADLPEVGTRLPHNLEWDMRQHSYDYCAAKLQAGRRQVPDIRFKAANPGKTQINVTVKYVNFYIDLMQWDNTYPFVHGFDAQYRKHVEAILEKCGFETTNKNINFITNQPAKKSRIGYARFDPTSCIGLLVPSMSARITSLLSELVKPMPITLTPDELQKITKTHDTQIIRRKINSEGFEQLYRVSTDWAFNDGLSRSDSRSAPFWDPKQKVWWRKGDILD